MTASKLAKAAALPPLSHRRSMGVKSGSYPSVPPLHPIFSFRTSGFEGGDGSWLQIAIEANCAQMEPEFVAVTFRGDIELEAVVDGLEGLLNQLRNALPVNRDGHHA
jgi:hypothetical protein